MLNEAKTELENAFEQNRGSKDLGVQKASAEAYLKKLERCLEEASQKLVDMQPQKTF